MSAETHVAPHPAYVHHFEDLSDQKQSASLGMWLFLAQEVMFFGGLFTTYIVYRNLYHTAFAAGSHHLDVPLGAFNTAVLICSSLTMALAVHAAALGHGRQAAAWLIGTVVLGSAFLGVKVVEYRAKFTDHLVPGVHFSGEHLKLEEVLEREHVPEERREARKAELTHQAEIYYSLYFGMTGLHALHMIAGIPILLYLALRAYQGYYTPDYHTPVEMTGLYWHFVDIVWIFLFPLLYLVAGH